MNKNIAITWGIQDVKKLEPTLTNKQAWQVLRLAERNHDCNVGINWDVLEYWIGEVKQP